MNSNQEQSATWGSPPVACALQASAVHIWKALLPASASVVEALRSTLSDDEQHRADGFHFERDRNRFILGRGALRNILSRYTGDAPEVLSFEYGHRGKPSLADCDAGVQFNVAHSGDVILYGVASAQAIGVDVERMNRNVEIMKIAERFFSEREFASLKALVEEEQQRAFFHCWARKESYLKATGGGISDRLDHFSVSISPNDQLVTLDFDDAKDDEPVWTVRSLDLGADYAAAVTVEGKKSDYAFWDWSM